MSFRLITILLLFTILISSCKNNNDEDAEPKTTIATVLDELYPYLLTITPNDDTTSAIIEWNNTDNEDFVQYELIGATDSFPDFELPYSINNYFPSSSNTDYFHRIINDYATNQHIDYSLPLAGYKYYRLYVKIGGDYLKSNIVKFNSGRTGTTGFTLNSELTSEGNLFLGKINESALFELKSGKQIRIGGPLPLLSFKSGDTGQGKLIYGITDFLPQFIIFNPDNFTTVNTFDISFGEENGYNFETSNNGFIIRTAWNSNFIRTLNASDYSLIESQELPNEITSYREMVKLSETKYLLPCNQNPSLIFTLDDQGGFQNTEDVSLPQELLGRTLIASPDKSKMVTTAGIVLTNINFEILATRDIITSAITFSHDSKSIYVGGIGKVTKLSAEDLSIIEEIELPDNLNVEQLISASDKLIVRHQLNNYTIFHTIHQ